ncbi:MAG: lipid-A-disaccharide synthase [Armatimonadota bacterium]
MSSSNASTRAAEADRATEDRASGGRPRIFVVAGEPSGDQHAALLGEALLRRRDLVLAGVGQRRMREAGFDLLCDSSGWSAIGVAESLRRVPVLLGRMRRIVGHLLSSPPDLLVLVDFGAFNVRLARRVRRNGEPPTLYYFPPRSWSRQADYRRLAGLVDRVATPFAWSEARLRAAGIDATWVGHPVVDRIRPLRRAERNELRAKLGLDDAATVIGLLPGSRPTEVACNGPQMLGAAREVLREMPDTACLLSVAPSLPRRLLEAQVRRAGLEERVTLVEGVTDAVGAADLVITSAGTATLEAAAALCPMIVAYRGTTLMSLEKRLRRFSAVFVGMPNIVAGERIVPELIDLEANAAQMARMALALLRDAGAMEGMRQRLVKVREQLGEPGVSDRVATMALQMLER